ncbi:UDP-glucose 4-epimerase GalE [Tessaracoccus lapidicaptus]|uniref:UDP-glucose 4-epimerase n=2 Tax=Propionibacteriaceae TaxID=31957 RepID=A0A1C0AIT2_9ACTN|nr:MULTISPECIES: UDP-glucose 4-epimerase GalE [Tessaracoccus]AQX15739.1 UDP-glucose 4-epimerase GalE [Tessaracoccus sp. T2.5-30]OCL32018.1 UDP-glucose 4-epimerase GalE [Tessaracoccus lapidicaptus]VEP40138.1 UDP-glucose 4-epimerase [Tessaracoccus lapidicaptus]
MKVLITGGAGYIGSTVASACEDAGHEVVILDDFSTGRREFVRDRAVYEGDFADEALLGRIFAEHAIDAVVHCAAKIVVPESVEMPLDYYENNVAKTITLLRAMDRAGVHRFLFSSSASIYAPDENFVVTEASPLSPGSPYARTKYMVEMILEDYTKASDMKVLSLRYFNPIGTDPQLRSGQQLEKPSHVLAKLLEAWSKGETFTVTGVEWPTRDGSGIRDFIHVWDLAQAHVAALEGFDKATAESSYEVFNIGTGNGVTVKELAASFEEISGDPLKVTYGPPRPGDVAGVYTVSSKAKDVLGWEAKLTEQEAVRDAIAWLPVRKEMLGY